MELKETFRKVRAACMGIALEIPVSSGESKFLTFGSGACVHPSGVIVTARHVVTWYYANVKNENIGSEAPSADFYVMYTSREQDHWKMLHAKPQAIWFHEEFDVAFIKIPEIQGGWPAFQFPDSTELSEGEPVATIGYPLRSHSDTNAIPNLFSGIISQVTGQYDEDLRGWVVTKFTMDMCVHPGNSGGPVFSTDSGRLLGIVTSQKLRPTEMQTAIAAVSNGDLASAREGIAPMWTNITYGIPWVAFRKNLDDVLNFKKPSNQALY